MTQLHTGGYKKVKKLIILATLLASFSMGAYAQITTVTATVTDSQGVTWANGGWQAQLIGNTSNPSGQYYLNGVLITPAQANATGLLNGAGFFTTPLLDNLQITPAGSQWKFTLCSNTSAPCSIVTTVVTGTSIDFSTLFTAQIVPPLLNAPLMPKAYADSEMAVIPASSSAEYYNVTNQVPRVWTGSQWVNIGTGGGGGGGSVPGGSIGNIQYNGVGATFAGDNNVTRDAAGNLTALSLNSVVNPILYTGADLNLKLAAICTQYAGNPVKVELPSNSSYVVGETFTGCSNMTIDLNGSQVSGDGALTGSPYAVNGHGVISPTNVTNFSLINGKISNGVHLTNYYFVNGETCIDLENTNHVVIKNMQLLNCDGIYAIGGANNIDLLVDGYNIKNFAYQGVGNLLGNAYQTWVHGIIDNCTDTAEGNCYGFVAAGTGPNAIIATPYSHDIYVDDLQVKNIPEWEAIDTHGGYRIRFSHVTGTNSYFGAQLGATDDAGYLITNVASSCATVNAQQECTATYTYTAQSGQPGLTGPIFTESDLSGQPMKVAITGLTNSTLNFSDRPAVVTAHATVSASTYSFTVKGQFDVIASTADSGKANFGYLEDVTLRDSTFTQGYVDGVAHTVNSFSGYAGIYHNGPPADTPATFTTVFADTPNWKIGQKVVCYDSNSSGAFATYFTGRSQPMPIYMQVLSSVGTSVTYQALANSGRFATQASTNTTTTTCELYPGYGVVVDGDANLDSGHYASDITIDSVGADGFGSSPFPLLNVSQLGGFTFFHTNHLIANNLHVPNYWFSCVNAYQDNHDLDIGKVFCGNVLGAPSAFSSLFAVSGPNNYGITLHGETFHSNPTSKAYAPYSIFYNGTEQNGITITDLPKVDYMNTSGKICYGNYLACGLAVTPNAGYGSYLFNRPGDSAFDVYNRKNWAFGGPAANSPNTSTGIYSFDPNAVALVNTKSGSKTISNIISGQARSVQVASNVLTIQLNTAAGFAGTETGVPLINFSNAADTYLNGITINLTSATTVSCPGVSPTGTCQTITAALTRANYGPVIDNGTLYLGGSGPLTFLPYGMNVSIPGCSSYTGKIVGNDLITATLDVAPTCTLTKTPIYLVPGTITSAQDMLDQYVTHHGNTNIGLGEIYGDYTTGNGPQSYIGPIYSGNLAIMYNAIPYFDTASGQYDQYKQVLNTAPSYAIVLPGSSGVQNGITFWSAPAGVAIGMFNSFFTKETGSFDINGNFNALGTLTVGSGVNTITTATGGLRASQLVPDSGGAVAPASALPIGTTANPGILQVGAGCTVSGGIFSCTGSGGGGGSVTSVGSNNLTGLFTSTVANATTTPQISYAFASQSINTFLAGPCTGGSGTLAFRTICSNDLPFATAAQFGAVQLDSGAGSGGVTLAKVARTGVYTDLTSTPSSLPPSGAAGNDLSGTYPSPTVFRVNNGTIPASAACLGSNSASQLIVGSCSGGGGNTTSTSLTNNTIPVANGANSIINSLLTDNGNILTYSGANGFALNSSVNGAEYFTYTGTAASSPGSNQTGFTVATPITTPWLWSPAGAPPSASGIVTGATTTGSIFQQSFTPETAFAIPFVDATGNLNATNGPLYLAPGSGLASMLSIITVGEIQLGAGSYTYSSTTSPLVIPDGVSLRGAGKAQTILSLTTAQYSGTNTSCTTSTCTITAANSLTAGQKVAIIGSAIDTALNGTIQTVISTGLSSSQFEFTFAGSAVSGADTTTSSVVLPSFLQRGSSTTNTNYPNGGGAITGMTIQGNLEASSVLQLTYGRKFYYNDLLIMGAAYGGYGMDRGTVASGENFFEAQTGDVSCEFTTSSYNNADKPAYCVIDRSGSHDNYFGPITSRSAASAIRDQGGNTYAWTHCWGTYAPANCAYTTASSHFRGGEVDGVATTGFSLGTGSDGTSIDHFNTLSSAGQTANFAQISSGVGNISIVDNNWSALVSNGITTGNAVTQSGTPGTNIVIQGNRPGFGQDTADYTDKTTVNCATSGTVTYSQPKQSSTDKKVIAYAAACVGAAAYTFPTAFLNTPEILTSNELSNSLATSLSTTAVTITGSTSTGFLIIEGW